MATRSASSERTSHTYPDGTPYLEARGRYAARRQIEDRLEHTHAVVDLSDRSITPTRFISAIVREMRIR